MKVRPLCVAAGTCVLLALYTVFSQNGTDTGIHKKIGVVSTIVSKEKKVKPHPVDLLVDGDKNTFYWSGAPIKKSDNLTVVLKEVAAKGKTIKVYTGFGPAMSNRETGDMLEDGILLAKRLGSEKWVKLAKFHGGNAEAKLPFATQEVRIQASAPRKYWVAFR